MDFSQLSLLVGGCHTAESGLLVELPGPEPPDVTHELDLWFISPSYKVVPPQLCLLVYKSHEYYRYNPHKP